MIRCRLAGGFVKTSLPMAIAALLTVIVGHPAIAGSVSFSIRPETGIARFIDRRSFKLCRINNVDPWNDEACSGWRPLVDRQTIPLRGVFCVYGEWGPHQTHRGSFEMLPAAPSTIYSVIPRETKGTCS
jgi:hypothetical protein